MGDLAIQRAINNGACLGDEHLDFLSSKVDVLSTFLSSSFVDQSEGKVKRASLIDKKDEIVVDLDDESGRQYSPETTQAIESGGLMGLLPMIDLNTKLMKAVFVTIKVVLSVSGRSMFMFKISVKGSSQDLRPGKLFFLKTLRRFFTSLIINIIRKQMHFCVKR